MRINRFFKLAGLAPLVLLVASCHLEAPKEFNDISKASVMIDVQDREVPFGEILKKHEGKRIFIDVWASWCGDCLRELPKIKKLQKEHPEMVYLMLSVDKNTTTWNWAVENMNIDGEHYYQVGEWDSDFNDYISLRSIPRYILVDEEGKIELFDFDEVSDQRFQNIINP